MGHSSLLVTCLTVVLEIMGSILPVGTGQFDCNKTTAVDSLGYGLHIPTAVRDQLTLYPTWDGKMSMNFWAR